MSFVHRGLGWLHIPGLCWGISPFMAVHAALAVSALPSAPRRPTARSSSPPPSNLPRRLCVQHSAGEGGLRTSQGRDQGLAGPLHSPSTFQRAILQAASEVLCKTSVALHVYILLERHTAMSPFLPCSRARRAQQGFGAASHPWKASSAPPWAGGPGASPSAWVGDKPRCRQWWPQLPADPLPRFLPGVAPRQPLQT